MAYTTISISTDAHKLLRDLKRPGDSFTDVILRHVQPPAKTAGEILARLSAIEGEDFLDDDLMRQVLAGRGRRSKRPAPHAR